MCFSASSLKLFYPEDEGRKFHRNGIIKRLVKSKLVLAGFNFGVYVRNLAKGPRTSATRTSVPAET
jgi:hypothetical protein